MPFTVVSSYGSTTTIFGSNAITVKQAVDYILAQPDGKIHTYSSSCIQQD